MSRYVDQFSEEEIIMVLRAYLLEGESHRSIQKNILGLPAPARGGGFVAMDLLHSFNVKGEHKGILKAGKFISDSSSISNAIVKVQEFIKFENLAKEAIYNKNSSKFDNTPSTEIDCKTKRRIGQGVLRRTVLDNYSGKCALCGIHQEDLLICSHIVPWKIDTENRLNPANAIALCRLHDGLFDKGYISLDDNYDVIYSDKSDAVIKDLMRGKVFREPMEAPPEKKFLKYHRAEICK